MLGLCKAVKRQARTTLMSGNVHENCKVGKTSYQTYQFIFHQNNRDQKENPGRD